MIRGMTGLGIQVMLVAPRMLLVRASQLSCGVIVILEPSKDYDGFRRRDSSVQ